MEKCPEKADISDFRGNHLRTHRPHSTCNLEHPSCFSEIGKMVDYKMVLRYAHLSQEHLARFVKNSNHDPYISFPRPPWLTTASLHQSPDSFRSEISSQIPPTIRISSEDSAIGNIVESHRTIVPSTENVSTV